MIHIREVNTGSNKVAVQAIYYRHRKRVVLKHFGSAGNAVELAELKKVAKKFMDDYGSQLPMFPQNPPTNS